MKLPVTARVSSGRPKIPCKYEASQNLRCIVTSEWETVTSEVQANWHISPTLRSDDWQAATAFHQRHGKLVKGRLRFTAGSQGNRKQHQELAVVSKGIKTSSARPNVGLEHTLAESAACIGSFFIQKVWIFSGCVHFWIETRRLWFYCLAHIWVYMQSTG